MKYVTVTVIGRIINNDESSDKGEISSFAINRKADW